VDVGVLAQTDAPVASLGVSEAARLSVVSPQVVFTVRQGRRYAATIVLSGLEQLASNGDIAHRLKQYGFVDVVVTGSGSTRRAEATWNGPDTTAQLDNYLRDITEIVVAAAPSSGVATNAASAPALTVVGGRSKSGGKKAPRRV
jgi:hypothetical protein